MRRTGHRCQVCRHPERWRIELLRAGGASLESLAAKFDLGADAIFRHWHKHVTPDAKAGYLAGPAQMAELHAKAAAEGESVLDYLRIVRTTLMAQLAACGEAGDARGAATVAGTLLVTLEKLGRITGEIAAIAAGVTNNTLVLINSPEWASIQADLLRALAPHPAARAEVVAMLRRRDAAAVKAAPVMIEATALPPAAVAPLRPQPVPPPPC